MANVRLLRQGIEDYQEDVMLRNRQIKKANTAYQASYDQYANDTNAYNAYVNSFNAKAAGGGVYSEGGAYFSVATGDPAVAGSLITQQDGTQVWEIPNSVAEPDANGSYSTYLPYIGEKPGAAPAAPAEPVAPEAPKVPSLTNANLRELGNPGLSPGELEMSRAKGIDARSQLAGDEMKGANSAFADPDDPNNLKERGILARVMGGQL